MKLNVRKFVSILIAALLLLSSGLVISRSTTAKADGAVLQQTDPAWNYYPYGDGNLGDSGCGVLAIVNAVRYLTGNTMDVFAVADWGSANEYIWGVGSSFSIAPNAAAKFGSTYGFQLDTHYGFSNYTGDCYPGSEETYRAIWNTLVTKLSAGEVAVGLVHNHFIAIVDYDSATDRVLVYDPGANPSRRLTTTAGDWKTYDELDYWSSAGTSYLKLRGYLTYYFKTGSTAAPSATETEAVPDFNGTTDAAGIYQVTTDGSALNMRNAASTSGDVITQIPAGAKVQVLESNGTWAHATYNGISGYCSMAYLTAVAETTTATTTATTDATAVSNVTETSVSETVSTAATTEPFSKDEAGKYIVSVKASYLNMRAGASLSADIITTIPNGTTVTVTEANSEWAAVTWGDFTGYCAKQYLVKASETTASAETEETATTTTTTTTTTDTATTMMEETTTETTTASAETTTTEAVTSATEEQTTASSETVTSVSETESEAAPGAYVVDTEGAHLNLRSEASMNGKILAQIPNESEVFVISANGEWANVSWNGIVGYCKEEYLTQVIIEADKSASEITSIDSSFATTYGDVNMDYEVTMTDVVLLHKALTGAISLNQTAAANADCYRDGVLSTVDATVIIQSILNNCTMPVQPIL